MGALTVARCSDAAGCYRPGGSGGCAAFPKGNIYLRLRDEIGPLFDDAMFAALFPERGQPAAHPWRLAPMTVMQFMEGLSDRQCAEAVRGLSACASARRRRKGAGSTVSAPMTPRSIVHLFGLMYGELGFTTSHNLQKCRSGSHHEQSGLTVRHLIFLVIYPLAYTSSQIG
jgi:hypothetical protein